MNLYKTTCFFLLLTVFLTACDQKESEFDRLRTRYDNQLIAPNADITDEIVRTRIEATDQYVTLFWEQMDKSFDKNYLWEDLKKIDYIPGEVPHGSVSSKFSGHFGRLTTMAQAFRTKGSKYYQHPEIRKDIIHGLDWAIRHGYHPQAEWYDNWWDWVIGIPMTLNNLLVLMYDELTEEQISNAVAGMDFFAPNVTYEGASTGANKIWQCRNMILRGIIAQRPDQIEMGVKGLDSEFKYVTTHDGFYRDGSFVQHQWHAYTGGYGRSMLRELTEILVMVQDSPWEIQQGHQEMIYEWIHHSFAPVVYRGALMDMVRGREASRQEPDRAAGHSLLISFIRLSEIAPEKEKKYLQSFVKAHILEDTERPFLEDMPTYLLDITRNIIRDPAIEPMPPRTFSKIFASMDRAVHIRPGFAFGLSMSSARIENYETINGENLKGWYTGDGMTYLYDNDLKQYSEDFWPTVNAYRMPGTTVDTRPREARALPFGEGILYADGYKSPRNWVGGASVCDSFSMAGMWYDAQDCTLEAKKSWLMAGDVIVALGAGINSRDNRTIETIVENRKLNENETHTLYADSKIILSENGSVTLSGCHWIHYEATDKQAPIGYYFPQKHTINALRETRTGAWYEINQLYAKGFLTKDYVTCWIDHGKNPVNATYTYVLLPGKSRTETIQYANNPDIEILSNTPKVQAVYHQTERVTGINFWEATSLPAIGITVDTPASVVAKETDQEYMIAIADPTHLAPQIVLSHTKSFSELITGHPNIKVISLSPLKIEVTTSGTLGVSQQIVLKK